MSDLNDFLKLVAEGKKNTPSGRLKQIEEQVKGNIKSDLSSLFSQLSSVKTPAEKLAQGEEVSVTELPEIKEEIVNIVKEQVEELKEVALPTPIGKVPDAAQIPDLDKYLKAPKVTNQEAPLTNEFKQVTDKIKFLERWVSQIQNTGPGSGEVNFRYLDDVNRLTMADSNDNWVLEYDAATKKVQFTKNIGPIETIEFDTSHVDDGDHPTGTLCWNAEDMTLNLHHVNGIRQQIGQEQYFPPVKNMTGAKIPNGAACMFAGAEEVNNARLLVAPMIADGTYPSLYLMGVATEDIEDGSTGFVTAFGYVNDIDTSAWNKGDILYADPEVPGGLTNVKPTAPNNVVPVAAVVRKNATTGRIMVRPTVEQKMLYATFSSTADQNPAQINTPYAVVFNSTDIARGFHADGQIPADYSKIYAEESGYFKFTASLSLTSTNSSAKAFYVWLRKNGVDVPRSAERQSVSGNGTYQMLTYIKTISLDKGDYIQIMYAVSDITISINAPDATAFCPAIPAATLVCVQVAL
jgi:hypothetical protein